MTTPVEYAEKHLGVHSVYEEALKAQEDLENVSTELDTAQDARRRIVDKIADRESGLFAEKRAAHAEKSDTWLKEHMTHFKREDPELKTLRQQLLAEQGNVSAVEYDLAAKKSHLEILTARMTELGGYFNYLAAAMNQNQSAEKNHESKESQGD